MRRWRRNSRRVPRPYPSLELTRPSTIRRRSLPLVTRQPHPVHVSLSLLISGRVSRRLARRPRLPGAEPWARAVGCPAGCPEHGRVLRRRARHSVVAGGHLHGRDHLQRRHSALRGGQGGRRGGKLGIVVITLAYTAAAGLWAWWSPVDGAGATRGAGGILPEGASRGTVGSAGAGDRSSCHSTTSAVISYDGWPGARDCWRWCLASVASCCDS